MISSSSNIKQENMADLQCRFGGGKFGHVQFIPDTIDQNTPGHVATKCAIVSSSISGLGRTDFAFVKRCSVMDDKAYAKLRNEEAVLKNLNHNHIIKYIGCYEGLVCSRKMLYVATEFSDETVYDFLRSNKDLNVKSWSVQATEALHYLQTRNEVIFHQDICSHNFLIVGNSSAQVLRLTGFHSPKVYTGVTSSGRTDNTELHHEWKAPEVLTEGKVSKQSDIYSLIIFIWELHTRQIPFEKYNHDAYKIIEAVAVHKERPDISEGLREDLRDLLTRGWSEEKDTRPDTSFILETLSNM